jgi:16S rRNA (cytidine1402-2'-O)-methyltransferase
VAGAEPSAAVAGDADSLRAAVAEREADGMPRKDAIVEVARVAGVPKRTVYQAVHIDG